MLIEKSAKQKGPNQCEIRKETRAMNYWAFLDKSLFSAFSSVANMPNLEINAFQYQRWKTLVLL